jgi:hypothetical protein
LRLDPVKVAQVILRLAASDSLPAYLLLGSDAVQFASQGEATRAVDAEHWREIRVSTDVHAPGSSPDLRSEARFSCGKIQPYRSLEGRVIK